MQIRNSHLVMDNLSAIYAETAGSGAGGDLTINSRIVEIFGNPDGNGNLTMLSTNDNDITASSKFGLNGSVQINRLGFDPSSGLIQLPDAFVDSSREIVDLCGLTADNSFVIMGRCGLPASPLGRLEILWLWEDLRDLSEFQDQAPVKVPPRQSATSMMLIEANAWRLNAEGVVELYAAGAKPEPMSYPVSCAKAARNRASQ